MSGISIGWEEIPEVEHVADELDVWIVGRLNKFLGPEVPQVQMADLVVRKGSHCHAFLKGLKVGVGADDEPTGIRPQIREDLSSLLDAIENCSRGIRFKVEVG